MRVVRIQTGMRAGRISEEKIGTFASTNGYGAGGSREDAPHQLTMRSAEPKSGKASRALKSSEEAFERFVTCDRQGREVGGRGSRLNERGDGCYTSVNTPNLVDRPRGGRAGRVREPIMHLCRSLPVS